jgi:hypothetical protein
MRSSRGSTISRRALLAVDNAVSSPSRAFALRGRINYLRYLPRTMKQASLYSSTDHGGGKRRAVARTNYQMHTSPPKRLRLLIG